MDAAVGGELGVEGGSHEVALAHQGGESFALGEDLDGGAGAGDAGGANEDHFKRAAGQGSFGGENGGVDLAAVGVAFNDGVEQAEGTLGRMEDFAGEQDGSGAGAEDGLGLAELLQGVEEVAALEEFEHGSGFATGEDEGVEGLLVAGVAVEAKVFGGFDERRDGAAVGEGLGVGGVVALEGEDADAGAGGQCAFLEFISSGSSPEILTTIRAERVPQESREEVDRPANSRSKAIAPLQVATSRGFGGAAIVRGRRRRGPSLCR